MFRIHSAWLLNAFVYIVGTHQRTSFVRKRIGGLSDPFGQPPHADAVGAFHVSHCRGVTLSHGYNGRLIIFVESDNQSGSTEDLRPKGQSRDADRSQSVVCCDDFGLGRAVRHASLFLALPGRWPMRLWTED